MFWCLFAQNKTIGIVSNRLLITDGGYDFGFWVWAVRQKCRGDVFAFCTLSVVAIIWLFVDFCVNKLGPHRFPEWVKACIFAKQYRWPQGLNREPGEILGQYPLL